MRSTYFLSVLLTLLPSVIFAEELYPVLEVRYLMGTRSEIVIYHSDSRKGRKIVQGAFDIIESLDMLLSNYRPSSELSLLNANTNKRQEIVSPKLHRFLSYSRQLTQKTHGFFDITVKPLVDLWREAAQVQLLPDQSIVDELLKKTGVSSFIPMSAGRVSFIVPDLKFDSGGIGKGYAVDRAIEYLKSKGVRSAFVSIGESSIRAYGKPVDRKSWSVLFKFSGKEALGMLDLDGAALSATDTHSQTFQIGNDAYGHLINPKTGYPAKERVQSAVIAETATEAEALTKLLALQPTDLENLQKVWQGVEAFVKTSGRTDKTDGFIIR